MSNNTKAVVGKGNSLFYALVVGGFLIWQSISISYNKDGLEVKTQQVPLPILTPCLVFMAAALGINLSDTLGKIAEIVNRNSAAISTLKTDNLQELVDEAVDKALEEKNINDNGNQ